MIRRPTEALLLFTHTAGTQPLPVPRFLLDTADSESPPLGDLSKSPLLNFLLEMTACGIEKICVVPCGDIDPVNISLENPAGNSTTDEHYNKVLVGMLQSRVRVVSVCESEGESFGQALSRVTAEITGMPSMFYAVSG